MVPNFLLKSGDKPENKKGEGEEARGLIWKWGVTIFFITLQFNHIYCV